MPEDNLISLDELNASVKEKELPSLDDLNKGLKKKESSEPIADSYKPVEPFSVVPQKSESESTTKTDLPKVDLAPDVGVKPGETTSQPSQQGTTLKTVAQVKEEGKKPTFENYIASGVTGVGSQLVQGAKGIKTILDTPEKVIDDLIQNRKKPVVEQIKKQAGDALDLFNGMASAAFGALSATGAGAAVATVGGALPEEISKWLFSPATSVAEKLGYTPKEGELGQKVLTFADILAPILVTHGVSEIANKIKGSEPLTPEESKQVSDIVKDIKPEDLTQAVADNADKFEPRQEDKVVSIIEKAKEGKDIKKDVAKLSIDKDKFNQVVDLAAEGDHLSADKADELKKQFEGTQAAKELIPDEHKDNHKIVGLIAEKNALLEKKSKIDKAFHPEIDELITGKDNPNGTHTPGIDDKIQKLTAKAKEDAKNTAIASAESSASPTAEAGTETAVPVSPKGSSISVAPFYDTRISSAEEAESIRKSPAYKEHMRTLPQIAEWLGIKVKSIDHTIGGFEDNTEVSNRVHLDTDNLDIAEKYAALAQASRPEVQKATFAGKYTGEGHEGQNATEIEIPVSDTDGTIKALKDAGIKGFEMSDSGKSVKIIDLQSGNDLEFNKKLSTFVKNLEENGIKHGKAEGRSIESREIDHTKALAILRNLGGELELRQSGSGFHNFVTKAIGKVEEFGRQQGLEGLREPYAELRDKQIKLSEEGKRLPDKELKELDRLYNKLLPKVEISVKNGEANFKEAKADIDKVGEDVVGDKGFVAKFPIKNAGRGAVKTLRWYKGQLHWLGDGARSTVIVYDKADIRPTYEKLKEAYNGGITREESGATDLGYPKQLLEVRTKNGTIAEFQVMTPDGYLAKDGIKDFPEDKREFAKEQLTNIQNKLGFEIPDGAGHYFYEINRDTNVPNELRNKADKLSKEYYDAMLKPSESKLDGWVFQKEVAEFVKKVDKADKRKWDNGNKGIAPESVKEFISKELTIKPKENAVQEQGASSVLQHPQGGVGETGSERGGVEQVEQGKETSGTRSAEEVKVGEGEVNPEFKDPLEEVKKDIADTLAELKERNKGKLRSGPGLENLDLYTKLAYLHIKKGVKTIAEFAKSIGEEVSDTIKKAWADASAKHEEEGEKGFIKTLADSPKTTEGLNKAAGEMDKYYKVVSNPESIRKADAAINKDLGKVRKEVLESKDFSPETSVKAIRLIKHFEANKDYDAALEMIDSYDKQLREAGRFIQAASLWNKLAPETMVRAANKVAGKYKTELSPEVQKYILKRMGEIDRMGEGKEKDKLTLEVLNYIADQFPATKGEMFDAYRYQNMLSNPRSHIRNIHSNLFNALITRPLDMVAEAGYDLLKNPYNPAARDVWMSDLPKYYKDVWNSIPNAWEGFKEAMANGYISQRILDIGSTESRVEAMRRAKLPKLLTAVPRFMEAQDNFFSIMIAQGEKSRLMEKGASETLATDKAKALAQKYLYREKLGEETGKDNSLFVRAVDGLGVMAGKGRNIPVIGKLWSWFVPFITTPINVAKQGIERSPLGFMGGSYSKEQIAKATLGSVISGAGAMLAMQGKTTWAVPTDKKERQLFYDSGRKPYSVQIGDKWVPMYFFGPYALPLAIPASLRHYQQDGKGALSDNELKHISDATMNMIGFITSQTPLSGFDSFTKALQGDLDYTNLKALAYSSEQIIPMIGLVKYINTIMDPVYRKTSGYVESIEKDLPGLSKDFPAYPGLGGPAHRDPWNYVLPYDVGLDQKEFDLPLAKRRELLQKRQVILNKNK